MDSQHATLDDLNDQGVAREVHNHPHSHPTDGPERHYVTNAHADGGSHNHIHVRTPSSTYDHHDFGPADHVDDDLPAAVEQAADPLD